MSAAGEPLIGCPPVSVKTCHLGVGRAGEDPTTRRAVLGDALDRMWVSRGDTGRRTEARSEYNAHYKGEIDYDDMYEDHPYCASCAIEHSDGAYDAGPGVDYSLNTGGPPRASPTTGP